MTVIDATVPHRSLTEAVRAGDEQAFCFLVGTYHAMMDQVARCLGASPMAAADVVREAWQRIVRQIRFFDDPPETSLKLWVLTVVLDCALSHPECVALGEFFPSPTVSGGCPASESAARFFPVGHPKAGQWADPPAAFDSRTIRDEGRLQYVAETAMNRLPADERCVMYLRDVHGCTSGEVGQLLHLSDDHQRYLLRRARAAVRTALEPRLCSRGSSN